MIILRQKEYSSTKELISLGVSGSLFLSGIIVNLLLFKSISNKEKYKITSVSKEKLLSYIKKEKDIRIIEVPKNSQDFYCSALIDPCLLNEKDKEKFIEQLEEEPVKNPKTQEEIINWSVKNNIPVLVYYKSDAIIAIAHEFGHYIDNRERNKEILRYSKFSPVINSFSLFVSGILGFFGPLGTVASVVTSFFSDYPELKCEFKASWYAMKILEELGATKEDLEKAKRYYKEAFGTYLSNQSIGATAMSSIAPAIKFKLR